MDCFNKGHLHHCKFNLSCRLYYYLLCSTCSMPLLTQIDLIIEVLYHSFSDESFRKFVHNILYIISRCSNQHTTLFKVCEFLNLYATVTFLQPDWMRFVLIQCISYLQSICGHPSVWYNGAWNFIGQGEHHLYI